MCCKCIFSAKQKNDICVSSICLILSLIIFITILTLYLVECDFIKQSDYCVFTFVFSVATAAPPLMLIVMLIMIIGAPPSNY